MIDMALSFADKAGCKRVWDEITRAQMSLGLPTDGDPAFHRSSYSAGSFDENDVNGDDVPFRSQTGDWYMENTILGDDGRNCATTHFFSLPSPSRNALEQISHLINDNTAMGNTREKIVAELSSGGKFHYLEALLDIFRRCEDQEDIEGLQLLYRIFRSLFLLADPDLLKFLLSEERYMDVVGVLEYDPEYYSSSVGNEEVLLKRHREFLRTKVEFKQVVEISDESVVRQIHQNFLINYLKDVILPRTLDDSTFAALSHLIYKNNSDIVMYFISDSSGLEAIEQVITKLKSDDPEFKEPRRDHLKLLVELHSLAKSMICSQRERFHGTLFEMGLFQVCTVALMDEDPEVQLLAAELISATLQHNQTMVRGFMNKQGPKDSLLSTLVGKIGAETDSGVFLQVIEILKTLLDPEGVASETDRQNFYSLFYENFMVVLLKALQETSNTTKNSKMLKSSICDFFSACVMWHEYRATIFVLRNNVISKVLELLKSESGYLAVSAVRFFRSCVGSKDVRYHSYIVQYKLIEPICSIFEKNGNKDNLLNSAVLELVDYLTNENVKLLLKDLIDHYEAKFRLVHDSALFRKAKNVYEENRRRQEAEEAANSHSGGDYGDRRHQFGRRSAPDLDEDEAYFESDDGDELGDDIVGPNPPPADPAPEPDVDLLAEQEAKSSPTMDVTVSSADGPSPTQPDDSDALIDTSTGVKPLVEYPNEEDEGEEEQSTDRSGENGVERPPNNSERDHEELQDLKMSMKVEMGQVSSTGELPESNEASVGMEDSSTPLPDEKVSEPGSPPDSKRRKTEISEENENEERTGDEVS